MVLYNKTGYWFTIILAPIVFPWVLTQVLNDYIDYWRTRHKNFREIVNLFNDCEFDKCLNLYENVDKDDFDFWFQYHFGKKQRDRIINYLKKLKEINEFNGPKQN